MADLYRAAGGADIAGDAAEGFFGAAFVIAALGQGDVLHDVDALGAALRTGVAMNAVVDFRVKLPYDVAGQGQIVDIVILFIDGKGFQASNAHPLFYLRLTG